MTRDPAKRAASRARWEKNNPEKLREKRRRYRATLSADKVKPEQHGTETGYTYGCRCDACLAAQREGAARRRRARGIIPRGPNIRYGGVAFRTDDTDPRPVTASENA